MVYTSPPHRSDLMAHPCSCTTISWFKGWKRQNNALGPQ
jgi:hypothetical protein